MAITGGLALAPSTSRAAPAPAPTGVLVLSGSGAGWADVVLPRPVSFMSMRLTGTIDQNRNRLTDGWSWTGCGGIRGFYLRPATGDPMKGAGAIDFAQLRWGAPTDLGPIGGPVPRQPTPLGVSHMGIGGDDGVPARLPAGRYRAYLIGEGACQVRVRLTGLTGTVRIAATRKATMQHAVRDLEPAATMAAPLTRALAANVPVTVGPSTLGFAFVHRMGLDSAHGPFAPSAVSVWEACIEQHPAPVCSGTPVTPPGPGRQMYANGSWGMPARFDTPAGPVMPRNGPFPSVEQIGNWYRPRLLEPGDYTAKVVCASAPTTTALQAAVFTLDL